MPTPRNPAAGRDIGSTHPGAPDSDDFESSSPEASAEEEEEEVMSDPPQPAAKRPRGRPRKRQRSDDEPTPLLKRRGRPPKSSQAGQGGSTAGTQVAPQAPQTPQPKRRGRPPKSSQAGQGGSTAGTQVAPQAPQTPQPKRRGRPLKSSQAGQGQGQARSTVTDGKGTRARASKNAPEADIANERLKKAIGRTMNQRLKSMKPTVREGEAGLDVVVGPDQPTFNDRWTQADELALEWNSSPEKTAFEGISGREQSLLSAWKICIRLFRCSPFTLLSPRRGLCYQEMPGYATEPPQILWGQNFCKELCRVMTHPIWNGDVDVLAMALQYTVICRTDDRRVWDIPAGVTDGGVLGRLEAELDESQAPLPCSVHDMYMAARSGRAGKDQSALSNLMARIGRITKNRRSTTGRHPDDVAEYRGLTVYGVTKGDLSTIRLAIDTMDYFGTPILVDTDDAYDHFLAARGSHDVPSGPSELGAFHRRAWLHEQRLMATFLGQNGRQDGKHNGLVIGGLESEDLDVQSPLPGDSLDAESERGANLPEGMDANEPEGMDLDEPEGPGGPEGLEGEDSPRSTRRYHALSSPSLGMGLDKALPQGSQTPGRLEPTEDDQPASPDPGHGNWSSTNWPPEDAPFPMLERRRPEGVALYRRMRISGNTMLELDELEEEL
ncbi:hypothetical protein Neosp_014277 [[Neocosmospora] mangrovei]